VAEAVAVGVEVDPVTVVVPVYGQLPMQGTQDEFVVSY